MLMSGMIFQVVSACAPLEEFWEKLDDDSLGSVAVWQQSLGYVPALNAGYLWNISFHAPLFVCIYCHLRALEIKEGLALV